MFARQHRDSGEPGTTLAAETAFGLASAEAANACLRRLRECSAPAWRSPSSEIISWVGLLVFVCELRQVLRCPFIGLAGVSRVLSASPESLAPVLERFSQDYSQLYSFGGQCHLVRLFRACWQAVDPC